MHEKFNAIISARNAGKTYAEIGHDFSLSLTRVRQILRKGSWTEPPGFEGLGKKLVCVLESCGINTLADLEAAIKTPGLLKDAPNVGAKSIQRLREFLTAKQDQKQGQ